MNRFILCLAATFLTIFVVWMVHDNIFLAALAPIPAAWLVGTGMFDLVDHLEATFESIRLRYGKVSLETINKHLRGGSPYTSAAPTAEAIRALDRIYPDGTTMSEDGIEAVFASGTVAEVRASLGYVDGKTWFEEAPGGLLVAELIHRTNLIKSSNEHSYDVSKKLEKITDEHIVFAHVFARPDLLAGVLLMKVEKPHLWSKVTDVAVAHRLLPARLLDLILQIVPEKDLNGLVRMPDDDAQRIWILLFERIGCAPKDYETILCKFAEVGVEVKSGACVDLKSLPNQKRLRDALDKVGEKSKAMMDERAKRIILSNANAYTKHEAETTMLRRVADLAMGEAGTAPVVRKRARL